MIEHKNISRHHLFHLIRAGKISFAGNKKLKIFGLLNCSSGKRMHVENRVFFTSESEAIQQGYRACKRCMLKMRKKQVE